MTFQRKTEVFWGKFGEKEEKKLNKYRKIMNKLSFLNVMTTRSSKKKLDLLTEFNFLTFLPNYNILSIDPLIFCHPVHIHRENTIKALEMIVP